jgi:hypothetical protein
LKQEKFLKHNKGESPANFNEIRHAHHRGVVEMARGDVSGRSNVQLARKAAEGRRSPRRFAPTKAIVIRASVLDCANPLALWSGYRSVRPCPHETPLFWETLA